MSVGTSGTITKPVANVPTRPPAVAHADSRPTTEPVSARSSQLHPGDGRRHRAEHGGRREQRHQRDREGRGVAPAAQRVAERRA